MNNEQQVFKKWFLDHAKAPIDPWHKEFAWSVWQARAALASAPEAGDVDFTVQELEHALWNSIHWDNQKPEQNEKVRIKLRDGQVYEAHFCSDDAHFYIDDHAIHLSKVKWQKIYPESVVERAARAYLAKCSPTPPRDGE